MQRAAVRVVIEGRVQRVGFRFWVEREAARLGLDGWVRNLSDGTVEALFAGPADAVRAMVDACRRGPAMASVSALRETPADPPAEAGFRHFR